MSLDIAIYDLLYLFDLGYSQISLSSNCNFMLIHRIKFLLSNCWKVSLKINERKYKNERE